MTTEQYQIGYEAGYSDGFDACNTQPAHAPAIDTSPERVEKQAGNVQVSGWLPIASAPKDGTVVLLFGEWAGEIHGPNKTMSIDIGFWQGGEGDYPGNDWWATTTGDAYACWVRATHWQPLPAAPSTKEGN